MKILSAVALILWAAVVATAAYADTLPRLRQCLGLPSPTLTIVAATQMQDWCDPLNNDILQADIFVKLSNGTKGGYLFSAANINCVRDAANIPSSVKTRFC